MKKFSEIESIINDITDVHFGSYMKCMYLLQRFVSLSNGNKIMFNWDYSSRVMKFKTINRYLSFTFSDDGYCNVVSKKRKKAVLQ